MTVKFKLGWAPAACAAVLLASLAGCNSGGTTDTTGGTTPGKTDPGTSSTTATRAASPSEGNKQSGDTIKIGLVSSENGESKPWGEDSDKGAKLAVEEFNAAGGVNGKKVELMIQDSGSKPEQGKSAAEKLISDGVLGLLGEVASGITAAMETPAFEKGVPVIAIGATRTDLTEKNNNIFRVCYTDAVQGPVMAKFAFDDLHLKNIAVITDKKLPYSTGLSDSFKKKFEELGGKIVDEQFYEQGQTQFSAQLTALKGKQPDGLFMSGYFNEVGPLAKQAKEAGLNVALLGGDGWDSREIVNLGGDAIIGGYFCNHYNNKEVRPAVADFLGKWNKKYGGEPGTTMGALSYDAAMVMLNALKTAKTMDSKGLIDAIENTTDYKGVSGDITLKGMGGNPHKRALIDKITKAGPEFVKAYEYDEVMKSGK